MSVIDQLGTIEERHATGRIAGVWNRDGSPVEPEMVHTMMRAVTRPFDPTPEKGYFSMDGETAWSYRPTLSGTPAERGLFTIDGDRSLTVLADARITNRKQLIRILELEDERTSYDAVLIATAYQHWGLNFLAHLLGAFAFVLWDASERKLICARDQMGMRPLYYSRIGHQLVIASEIKQILAIPGFPIAFNETTVGLQLVGFSAQEDATFFEDIAQVPRGHGVIFSEQGEKFIRYWQIDPQRRIQYRDKQEYVEHFRETFIDSVRCCLCSNEVTGVSLSGGLDSSAVTSVAAWLHQQGEEIPWPLHTFSWVFDELASADEREYSRAVNQAYGLTVHETLGDDWWCFKEDPGYLPHTDEPVSGYYQQLTTGTLSKANDLGVEVLFTGHPGDNLVGGNIFAYPNYLRRGQWIRLGRELWQHSKHSPLNVVQLFWNACVRPATPIWIKNIYRRLPMWRESRIPAWITPELSERVDLESHVQTLLIPPDGFRLDGGARYNYIFHPNVLRSVIAHDRLADRMGIVYREPWFDIRLIEFVIAVPAELMIRDGVRKIILREALEGILPEKVRDRVGKTYPNALASLGLREKERERVERLMRDTRMAAYGWVNEEAMQKHYDRYLNGEFETEWPLHQALVLEDWLRRYH
jgi:asparagine synthase (glutamine-hydrolysing)